MFISAEKKFKFETKKQFEIMFMDEFSAGGSCILIDYNY